ncbi:MAG: DUF4954 family protein [Candidatus Marinimicrobia bacterium]|nr:DUF4954 family protein [Candidatus Neomarinimicrobiota bacterium]
MDYRILNNLEIEVLEKQGCSAENWDTVLVKDGFTHDRVRNVNFGGKIRIGVFDKSLDVGNGMVKLCGLYNCCIRDCQIGDNVYISDVKNLAHYDIESDVVIENVASLIVAGETTFGNGTEIEILNEGGGRELPIFDKLSSQVAYFIVTYRHDSALIQKLKELVEEYVKSKRSTHGIIKQGARIFNSLIVRNVNIGESAFISGALHLEEGTIGSCKSDPTFIGEGVIAKGFIILSGTRIDGSAMLDHCFVGQRVQIGKQYSAENSAFFANSELFHGEACSIFAGPYTVTHHKSTLLIAGLFSFYNAGSGSNQSNHMYKLGPIHQGILERGAKTGSFSYMMWPCRIGAFTSVIGKHYSNFDTSDFPFSYIIESEGKSILIPTINLCTVGTRRDSVKWPARDRRKNPDKLDLINFELFSPYTIGKMMRGIKLLKDLYENSSEDREYIKYNGVYIKRRKLKSGYENYEMAINIYIGNEVVKRLEGLSDAASFDAVLEKLKSEGIEGCGKWVDISGMLTPISSLDKLMDSVRSGQISSVDDLSNGLRVIHEKYSEAAWEWCVDLIQKRLGVDLKDFTRQHIIKIIRRWEGSSAKFNSMVLEDAGKEFDKESRIGYGIDVDENVKIKDFEAVVGTFDSNRFVLELKKESETLKKRAKVLLSRLESLQ